MLTHTSASVTLQVSDTAEHLPTFLQPTMVSVYRLPLVACLMLALACTFVSAKVYTFTEQEGTAIFAPYSKLEDAKPGDSVTVFAELYQRGVIVGETARRPWFSSGLLMQDAVRVEWPLLVCLDHLPPLILIVRMNAVSKFRIPAGRNPCILTAERLANYTVCHMLH